MGMGEGERVGEEREREGGREDKGGNSREGGKRECVCA